MALRQLRPLVARTAAGPSTASRAINTSAVRRASAHGDEHGHDDHGHGSSEANTTESFFSPFWATSVLLVAGSVLIYPYLPATSKLPSSPSLSPKEAHTVTDETATITRLIKKYTPKAQVWTERNDKHLELTKENAETRLLFQEAERPRVWRMRYPSSFEQASPHSIPVGSQADLSDLKVKPE